MVIVCPVQHLDMQRDAGVHGERLEPLLHQLGVEGADLVAAELGLEHQERPARHVDGDARQRLVHRHMHVGIAGDALHVAERLLHRLAERDADVLGGVVVVDVQVALGLDRDVDARVPRQQIEHVVEEADAGRDVGDALAVEIDRDLDVGLLGGALDRAFAAAFADFAGGRAELFAMTLRPRAIETAFCVELAPFYQGSAGFATGAGLRLQLG